MSCEENIRFHETLWLMCEEVIADYNEEFRSMFRDMMFWTNQNIYDCIEPFFNTVSERYELLPDHEGLYEDLIEEIERVSEENWENRQSGE